jgi:hypothetical protein
MKDIARSMGQGATPTILSGHGLSHRVGTNIQPWRSDDCMRPRVNSRWVRVTGQLKDEIQL